MPIDRNLPEPEGVMAYEGDGYSSDRITHWPAFSDDQMRTAQDHAYAEGRKDEREALQPVIEALKVARNTLPHIGGNERSVHGLLQTIEAALKEIEP